MKSKTYLLWNFPDLILHNSSVCVIPKKKKKIFSFIIFHQNVITYSDIPFQLMSPVLTRIWSYYFNTLSWHFMGVLQFHENLYNHIYVFVLLMSNCIDLGEDIKNNLEIILKGWLIEIGNLQVLMSLCCILWFIYVSCKCINLIGLTYLPKIRIRQLTHACINQNSLLCTVLCH